MSVYELKKLKNKIFENVSIKKNHKSKLLIERMIISDKSFIVDLNEQENRKVYLNRLNESKESFFGDISNIALETNVLTGNYTIDSTFLKESTRLLKENKQFAFLRFVNESLGITEVEAEPEKEVSKRLQHLIGACLLSFQAGNSKLYGDVGIFALPAGWTCPFADKCLKKVSREKNPETGKLDVKRGKNTEFDCYAANAEIQYVGTRLNRWHNFDLLKLAGEHGGMEAQKDLIKRSIDWFLDESAQTRKIKTFRIHESGDFYNLPYLDAWMEVAKERPDLQFYAYTKSNPLIKQREEEYQNLPNFSLTLSTGGRADDDLEQLDIKQSTVYNSPEELYAAGKSIDLDDELAMEKGGREKDFGLLVHGTQEAGSDLAKDKSRNETFAAYWKYWAYLNDIFDLPKTHVIDTMEAEQKIAEIQTQIDGGQTSKTNGEFIQKLLRYIIKYNEFGFDEELENVIQTKYRRPQS